MPDQIEYILILGHNLKIIFSKKLGTAGLAPLSDNSCLSSFITGHLLKVFTGKITHNSFYL